MLTEYYSLIGCAMRLFTQYLFNLLRNTEEWNLNSDTKGGEMFSITKLCVIHI